MAARLPDELVKDILHSILDIPDHEFHDTSTQSPFARVVAPSSAALLVCKRWMRIATPLLYHNVVLRSSATAHSFCIAIKRQPEFAKLVKHLRVECPCPNILGDTAKRMTALATLHIDLASIGDNRLLGVAKLLAASNATHLSLARNKPVFNSTGRKKRLDAVIKWTNLRVLTLPQYDLAFNTLYVIRGLLGLVTSCKFLDELQLPVVKPHQLQSLFERIPEIVKHIQSTAAAGARPIITFVMRDWRLIDPKVFDRHEFDGKAHRIVRFRRQTSMSSEIYDLGDLTTVHGVSDIITLWSNPLESAPADVQRRIWQRIVGFAIFGEQKPVYLRRAWFMTSGLDVQSARALLLLNKYFADIVLFTLVEAVWLGSNNEITANLASQLQSRPELAFAVKELALDSSNDMIGDVVAEFSQLRRLTLSLNLGIDIAQLFEFFDASKATLCSLSVHQHGFWRSNSAYRWKARLGCSNTIEQTAIETTPVADASRLIDGMNSLSYLNCGAAYSSFVTPPKPNTLLALTDLELTVDCESASRWLAKCQLPLLTKLTLLAPILYMSTSQEADEHTPESSFNLFLHAHGSKIQQLCLKPYRFPVGEILQACPNIEHMVATESMPNLEGLSNAPAAKLKTLRIDFGGDPKSSRDWFGRLIAAICNGALSALEQLIVKTSSGYDFWEPPSATKVGGVAEIPWQGDASEKLKARGVVFTDTEGRMWRPRLAIQDVLRRSARVTAKPSGRR